MLPFGRVTPRQPPALSNSTSFITEQEEYVSPKESPWNIPVKGRRGDKSTAEPSLDIRPRKRRRVSSAGISGGQDSGSRPLRRLSSAKRLTTECQTCRKCMSNVQCARCATATCSICARTCTLGAISTPPTPLLCFSATPSPEPLSHRLSNEINVDELCTRLGNKRRPNSVSSSRGPEHDVGESAPGGCGRVVCQACCTENSDRHKSTCLDCLDGFGCPPLPTFPTR